MTLIDKLPWREGFDIYEFLRTECTFVVKEGVEGKPSVVAEPTSSAGLITLELTEGASLAQAEEIAAYLRRHVHAISIS